MSFSAGRLLASGLFLAVFGMTGCVNSQLQRADRTDLEVRNQALQQRVSELEQELQAAQQQPASEERVSLYFVMSTPTDFWLVPEVRTVPRQEDMMKVALEELIKGPQEKNLTSLIPKETQVLDVAVRNFIAYPNFSEEIKRMSVGSTGEALVLAAIANTLIKFPGVEKVQILIEGKPADSLAGHIDLTEPVGRNETLLRLAP